MPNIRLDEGLKGTNINIMVPTTILRLPDLEAEEDKEDIRIKEPVIRVTNSPTAVLVQLITTTVSVTGETSALVHLFVTYAKVLMLFNNV